MWVIKRQSGSLTQTHLNCEEPSKHEQGESQFGTVHGVMIKARWGHIVPSSIARIRTA